MSSCSNVLSTEAGYHNHQDVTPDGANLNKCGGNELEHEVNGEEDEDGDEEEDLDFYPFLKETPSLEASSSLSSEVEGLDADVVDSAGNTSAALVTNLSTKPPCEIHDYAVGDSEHGEEIVMQTAVSSGRACEKESEKTSPLNLRKRKSALISQPENETVFGKENGTSSGADAVPDMVGECSNTKHSRKPSLDIDDEDAICMRTRARYSLASFTLDELETFLQETDDDDDLQNVDDEEEYRKFLAAVLHGGDGDNQTIQENENVYDEDEDNDADFEIEIEEALETDFDENARGETQEKEYKGAGRRPETRQNRRQRSSARNKKKLLEQANRPLRPLLPNTPIVTYPVYDGKNLMAETTSHYLSSSAHDGFINGFTPHQLGQLHCLIHEHVQLLIQVFSICILEPSRQHIASEVQELISEMLHKRDQVLSWRRVPYPCFCFCPPYIHPSVPDEPFRPFTVKYTLDAQSECSSGNNELLPTDLISPSQVGSTYVSTGKECRFQTNEGSFWVPFKNGPILSVLDVAPLSLVGRYMDDISTAVRDYQRRHVEAACDTRFLKEPMFPLPSFQSSTEANGEGSRETTSSAANLAPSPPASDRPPKKTLAAALVERTKKQSVALVPREIAKLAQRFFPLFNPALFPHKPPPAPVVNRVLFTDSEDELLAMGLMEYNTDWKAIQQRFLPCKSKHQIFVRQKNRSSSKAPENPIKAVRRMKNSPLTAEEMARIQEGLKIFKLDWMSVWKFTVPYRDPSLLPRQWRIATGTQKSYKSNADKKEKRRLYESHRRKCKPPPLASWQTSSEKEDCHTDNAGGENNSGDDCIDDKDEAYVHEAFLADWRPGTSCSVSQLQVGSHVWEQNINCGSREPQLQIGHKFPYALNYSKNLHASHFADARCYTSREPIHPVSDLTLRSSKSQFYGRPYRARRANSARLVKLAPDLPPVNLPPSVRIMSQSAFRSYQSGTSTKFSAVDAGNGEAATENIVRKLPHVAKSGTIYPIKSTENKNNSLKHSSTTLHQQGSVFISDKHVAVEKDNSDLQMHPLLFLAPDDGPVPYYQLNCGSSAYDSFNFFSGNLPQLNLSLFRKPYQANSAVNFLHKSSKSNKTTSSSCGIDFHPLLQRSDNVNSDSATTHSAAQPYVNLESLRGKCSRPQNSSDAVLTKSQVNSDLTDTCTKTSTPCGKGNELDLDIRLSFTSRKEKAMRNRDVTDHNQSRLKLNIPDSEIVGETPDKLAVIPDGVNSNLDSGFHALVMSGSCINRYDASNIGEQSLPEIVMEQEELSDSEDEVGEHVEFECEEMADSEGEESESEQMVDMQNKGVPSVTTEKIVTDADFDDEQCEIGSRCKSQGTVCSHPEADTLELDLTQQGKDNPSSSVLLSLNSHTHNMTDPKTVESRNTGGLAGKHWASARPNRSCKKTVKSSKHLTSQKQAEGLPQQLEFSSLVDPLRKPRKRSCRTNLSQVKRDSSSNTGLVVDSSNHLCNDELE